MNPARLIELLTLAFPFVLSKDGPGWPRVSSGVLCACWLIVAIRSAVTGSWTWESDAAAMLAFSAGMTVALRPGRKGLR